MGKNKTGAPNTNVRKYIKMNIDLRDSCEEFTTLDSRIKVCQDIIPIPMEVLSLKERSKKHNIASEYKIVSWNPLSFDKNKGILTCLDKNNETVQLKAYKKIMPLITPYRWMKYKERPNEPFIWEHQNKHILSYENQAYVDTIASSLVSKIKREHNVPHFCHFYGSYRGVADVYLYNLEDDLDDFRFSRWFWEELEKNSFGLRVIEKETGRQLTFEECKELIKPDDSHLDDDNTMDDEDEDEDEDDEDEDEEDEDKEEIEDLTNPLEKKENRICSDLKSVGSISTCDDNIPIEIVKKRGDNRSRSSNDSFDTEISDAFEDEYLIHAELRGMPVSVVFLEEMDGTMDDLLESIQNKEIDMNESHWIAWIFQICASLTVLQDYLQLTHNDLHTNNIAWKETKEEYIYYKDTQGSVWKLPTFGKIYHIIDYGRSIFTINNHIFISSDYHDGHDAAGQYNFGSFQDKSKPFVGPNKSFDLSRLSCSLLRVLFPRNPPYKEKGGLLTQDGNCMVYETENGLFNMLWTWLKNVNGMSILEDGLGNEKYAGFDLYSHIAQYVKNAIPSEQFKNPIFQQYRLKQVPTDISKCIPLPL